MSSVIDIQQGIYFFPEHFFPYFPTIFLDFFHFIPIDFPIFGEKNIFPHFPRIQKSVRAALLPLRNGVLILCLSPDPPELAPLHFC